MNHKNAAVSGHVPRVLTRGTLSISAINTHDDQHFTANQFYTAGTHAPPTSMYTGRGESHLAATRVYRF